MAEYTTIVDPGNEQSEWSTDYTSLSAWEAGEQGLYSSGDSAIADCRRSTSTKDTAVVDFASWTSGVISKLIVHADYRHEGKWADTRSSDSNYIYTLETNGTCLRIAEQTSEVHIDGFLLDKTGTADYSVGIHHYGSGVIENCIIRKTGTAANQCSGILLAFGTLTKTVKNTIIYGFSGGTGFRGINASQGSFNISNVTIYGCYYGVYQSFQQFKLINSAILNCTDCSNLSFNNFVSGSDYNVTSDDVALGANAATEQTSYTDYFVDPSNGDFHLKNTSENLWGLAGTDLSGTFTTDIDGTTRSAWDIGADEYEASGATTRNLEAAIAGASTTPAISALISRSLLANIQGTSTTPAITAAMIRDLAASITGASTTSQITATLTNIISLIANIAGASSTSDIAATMLRNLAASIAGISTTTEIEAAVVRSIAASISGSSATPAVQASLVRSIIAAVQASSTTPEVQAILTRALSASVLGASTTAAITAQTVRYLIADITGASSTSDITATIQGIIDLVANIAGISVTPSIGATTARSLAADIRGQSTTPDISAALLRLLTANIQGQSTTSDITAAIENIINLVAGIQGISVTPAVTVNMARTLSAAITGQSVTPEIQATIARFLLADIQGTSVTPDDLVLILAGLGVITDPAISSLTVARAIGSLTVQRAISSLTVQRAIEAT